VLWTFKIGNDAINLHLSCIIHIQCQQARAFNFCVKALCSCSTNENYYNGKLTPHRIIICYHLLNWEWALVWPVSGGSSIPWNPSACQNDLIIIKSRQGHEEIITFLSKHRKMTHQSNKSLVLIHCQLAIELIPTWANTAVSNTCTEVMFAYIECKIYMVSNTNV